MGGKSQFNLLEMILGDDLEHNTNFPAPSRQRPIPISRPRPAESNRDSHLCLTQNRACQSLITDFPEVSSLPSAPSAATHFADNSTQIR
jgi:hypothetical protein